MKQNNRLKRFFLLKTNKSPLVSLTGHDRSILAQKALNWHRGILRILHQMDVDHQYHTLREHFSSEFHIRSSCTVRALEWYSNMEIIFKSGNMYKSNRHIKYKTTHKSHKIRILNKLVILTEQLTVWKEISFFKSVFVWLRVCDLDRCCFKWKISSFNHHWASLSFRIQNTNLSLRKWESFFSWNRINHFASTYSKINFVATKWFIRRRNGPWLSLE